MKNRRFIDVRRLLFVVMAICALTGAAPASVGAADTTGPTVTIDPALHFTQGGTYDWYANGDMTYWVFAKWHMSDASKTLTPGVVTDDPAAVCTNTWRTGTCFHEGCWMYSTIHKTTPAGATASFTVTGNAFALNTDKRGTFDVYFDGARVAHIVAGQSSVRNGYLSWVTYKVARATHTIKIVARSGRVDVDGVFVS